MTQALLNHLGRTSPVEVNLEWSLNAGREPPLSFPWLLSLWKMQAGDPLLRGTDERTPQILANPIQSGSQAFSLSPDGSLVGVDDITKVRHLSTVSAGGEGPSQVSWELPGSGRTQVLGPCPRAKERACASREQEPGGA